ncbi:MAG: flagellar protein FlgN [Betaproteobacteria bacterium]|nr:flagellar protein FlgN [Betaproteobacteria bacterium]
MPSSSLTNELAAVISAEAAETAVFISLLQEEQEVLQSGKVDNLEVVAGKKTESLTRLAPFAMHRNRILADAGFASDRVGIDSWLEAHPDDAIREVWQRLQAGAREARELNRINGELIQMRIQQNTQILDVLLSASQPRGSLYGPDGQPAQFSGTRIIDSA